MIEQAGLEVLEFRGVLGLGAVGSLMFQDALVRSLPKPLRGVTATGLQWGCAAVDRLHRPAARDEDAAVYVVVATPAGSGGG